MSAASEKAYGGVTEHAHAPAPAVAPTAEPAVAAPRGGGVAGRVALVLAIVAVECAWGVLLGYLFWRLVMAA